MRYPLLRSFVRVGNWSGFFLGGRSEVEWEGTKGVGLVKTPSHRQSRRNKNDSSLSLSLSTKFILTKVARKRISEVEVANRYKKRTLSSIWQNEFRNQITLRHKQTHRDTLGHIRC